MYEYIYIYIYPDLDIRQESVEKRKARCRIPIQTVGRTEHGSTRVAL